MISFDSWLQSNACPPENYSFTQYGKYIDGWRNSMPWAYKGMSFAYDQWAESRWDVMPYKENLVLAWKLGLQANYERLLRNDKVLTAEESADIVLGIMGAA